MIKAQRRDDVLDRGLSDVRGGLSAYAALREAFVDQRCVILDGETVTSAGADARQGERASAARALAYAPGEVLDGHRRYVEAGCDVITTATWGLVEALTDLGSWIWQPAQEPVRWTELAARGLRLARRAIAEAGREGEVAVAFSIDADVEGRDGVETVRLLSRVFERETPDLLLVEALSAVGPSLEATIEALLATDIPVWLSFRRCPHGVCGVYGQHWGGPEGDVFGRAARRFEELGVGALLIGCVPPDHADWMVSHLRDFTDLPLGVHPNLGYPTSAGWRCDEGAGGADYARMALRWRAQGAQVIGGCCGVGPEHIAAAGAALAGTRPGALRRSDHDLDRLSAANGVTPEQWRDAAGRSLYPLELPDLVSHGNVFVPSPGSFLLWRHLFREGVGRGKRCLDIGCGSGLQTIQLALNGAEHVDAIDVEPEAVDVTLTNAFRNRVAGRISVATADLYRLAPEERYDVIVASLYQAPVDTADYWGRGAFDHVLRLLPRALTDDGVAYLLQLSILSQRRTAELLEQHGLRARVVDFTFFPFTADWRRLAEQIARVERLSDAYHVQIAGAEVIVGYLLEVSR
jgi:homocysteine S-methyltransferase